MNWELLEDKQRKVFTIPLGKLSVKETEVLLKRLIKMVPDIRMEYRKLKIDKIMGRINEEKRPI